MPFADQLTLARIAAAPIVVVLFTVNFTNHDYWGTVAFCLAMSTDWFDGRIARRSGKTTSFGSLLDPVADKVLVLHPGKELALGPPNQVLSDPAVIAAYIGKR